MANRNSLHHLVPRSRLPECQIQRLNIANTSLKSHKVHRAWHDAFSNSTPFEALVFYLTEIRGIYLFEAEVISDWEGVFSECFNLSDDAFYFGSTTCRKEKFYILKDILKLDQGKFSFLNELIRHWAPSNYFYYINILDCEEGRFEYYSPEIMLSSNLV